MPTTCEFIFERASAIYYSGEQINGIIVLTTTKDLKVEALQINCRGCADVSWLEHTPQVILHNDGATEHQILKHQGYEMYIDEYQSQQQLNVIHAGRHEYKFSFQLPANCPATSSHKLGKIFYSVSLQLKRRTKFNKKFEQKFTVKNRLDLNAIAEKYKSPGIALESFGKSSLKLKFSTARTGYVPGQNVKFRLDTIGNIDASRKNVHTQVRLCQKYIFKCQPPHEQSREVIWKLATANMAFNTESSLRVPLLAPTSSNDMSAIISVAYYLEALVMDKFKRVVAKLCIPITVGTKALKGVDRETCEETKYCYDNFMVMECGKNCGQLMLTEVKTKNCDTSTKDHTLSHKIDNDKMSADKETAIKLTINKIAEKKMSSLLFTKAWPWKLLKKAWHQKLALTASCAQNLYTDQLENLKSWLQVNNSPWEDVKIKWAETFKLRRVDVLKPGNVNICSDWPLLKHSNGFSLIDIDFGYLYPNSKFGLIRKWEDFKNEITPQFNDKVKDKQNCTLLKCLNSSILNKNTADVYISLLLHALLPPDVKHVTQDNGKKLVSKSSIRDSQESFLIQVTSYNDIQRKIDEATEIAARRGEKFQPTIIAVASEGTIFEEFYIHFDKKKFKFDSFISSLDHCFKIFHVLNLKYPRASESVWLFIQKYFYNIQLKEDKLSTKVLCLLKSLKKITI